MSPFQTQVNQYPAPAREGDFASANPRASVLAGESQLVADSVGVTVGRFAWLDTTGTLVSSHGTYPKVPDGFVHNEMQSSINTWLAESGNTIPAGRPVTLHNKGDFWAKNTGLATSTIGGQVYATYGTGAITIGSAAASATATGSIGGSTTASVGATFTATGSDVDLTVTSVTGYIAIGDTISGTGVEAGTTIVSQTSGTPNGAGVYVTSAATTSDGDTVTSFGTTLNVTVLGAGTVQVGAIMAGTGIAGTVVSQLSGTSNGVGTYELDTAHEAYVAAGTVTASSTTMVITAVASGTLAVGMPVTGSNITANTVITALGSGTGTTGTYTVSLASTAASTTITGVGGVAVTGWKCASIGAADELVKISTWS